MKRKVKSLCTALILLVGMTMSVQVGAQSDDNSGSGGLSLSPTRFEFVIDRGGNEVASIFVENVSDQPIVAKAFLNDFEPEGLSGSPQLIVDDSQERSAHSIREFVVGLEDVVLEPKETKVLDVFLQIPENAAPGAYYGAIRFQTAPQSEIEESGNDSPQLALNASVASLILIEVPGDVTEKIEVTRVAAFIDENSGSLFTRKPNQIGVEIKNLGNGFSKPFGDVIVNGPWGSGTILNYELNDTSPRGNVLPNSSRLFLDEIDSVSWPGRYTIEANISHGNGGEVLFAKSTFWYLPTWFILIMLFVFFILAAISYYLYRKYKNRNIRKRR